MFSLLFRILSFPFYHGVAEISRTLLKKNAEFSRQKKRYFVNCAVNAGTLSSFAAFCGLFLKGRGY